jgi:hypothetical protein
MTEKELDAIDPKKFKVEIMGMRRSGKNYEEIYVTNRLTGLAFKVEIKE